jgi:hypothetical protein
MGKMIFQLTYWLGILCVVLAIAIRGLAVVGVNFAIRGTVTYGSFYRGALLLMVVAIASACYSVLENQKQQG